MEKIEDLLKTLSDKELKDYYIRLWESINVIGCFSARDVIKLELITQELERRGYEVDEVRKPAIRRRKG